VILTPVLNLSTGDEVFFSLPPLEALKSAWLQFEKRDNNTWDYKTRHLTVILGNRTAGIGNWAILR